MSGAGGYGDVGVVLVENSLGRFLALGRDPLALLPELPSGHVTS